MAKVLTELINPTTMVVTWRIRNFSELKEEKLYSEAFVADGFRWRILVFPKGNKVEDFSIYLGAADSGTLPSGWSAHLQFAIVLVNQRDKKLSITKNTQHEFDAKVSDWGFTSYMRLDHLRDSSRGYLVNDTVIIQFKVSLRQELDYLPGVDRQTVHFRSLAKPEKDDFCLLLSELHSYDDVVERVASQINLDNPAKIRLTSHNCHSQQPEQQPIEYRGVEQLSDMLVHLNQTSDILYYEVLDIPLPELPNFRNLRVEFHHATKDEVTIHDIRLPKQSAVGDVVSELKTKVELSQQNAELRLLEVFNHKIYRILQQNELIDHINYQFWTLRAEEILEEEENLGPHDLLIHVHHFTKGSAQNQMVKHFGKPFLLVIHEGETLSDIKVRVQKRLQVPDEEFAKWNFAFLSRGHPEYLQDSDVVYARFQKKGAYGGWEQYLGCFHIFSQKKGAYAGGERYLGLEHSDDTPKRLSKNKRIPKPATAKISLPPNTCSDGATSSSTSTQSSSGVQIISETSLAEPSNSNISQETTSSAETSNSSPSLSPDTLKQHRQALLNYFRLSLEDIDPPNAFDEIERITLELVKHSSNSLEKKIMQDSLSLLAVYKGMVPEAASTIRNVRARRTALKKKNLKLGARLDQGQEQLTFLEAKRENLSAKVVEVEAKITRLRLLKEEVRAGNEWVHLEMDRINEQVAKDVEERRKLDNEAEQIATVWLQAREMLARGNLSWKLYEQNLQLCKGLQ